MDVVNLVNLVNLVNVARMKCFLFQPGRMRHLYSSRVRCMFFPAEIKNISSGLHSLLHSFNRDFKHCYLDIFNTAFHS